VQEVIKKLKKVFYIRPKLRTTGVINEGWRTNSIGKHITSAKCKSTEELVHIHENDFVRGFDYAEFVEGKSISFELQERSGRYSGKKVAGLIYKETERLKDFDEESAKKLVARIRNDLYFPVIQVWRDGRSISDHESPKEFTGTMQTDIAYLVALLSESALPESVKNEIQFLLSCMHKDAPDECVQWITKQVENDNIRNPRTVGFALGDVSEQWQKVALSKLVAHPTFDSLRVFAYAIWRESHFVEKFNFAEIKSILKGLTAMLDCPHRGNEKDKRTALNWVLANVEPLELLLGLLRTRASSDSEIKMLLQPHQKITKELAKQVERVAEIVTQSNGTIFSRVQINVQKTKGDPTPDLLYALRLYLTGDDAANAIHITSVSDKHDD